MGVVLGAHQPGAVLTRWSGVKAQLLASAKDLEEAWKCCSGAEGGRCVFTSWASEGGGIQEQRAVRVRALPWDRWRQQVRAGALKG